jgi:predicted NAD/FAD-dependent oxidoreductase
MNEQRFPEGWDEQRVKRLIAELDACTDEKWIAADEAAAAEQSDQAVITVPVTLLPEIRRLLASHKTANRQNLTPGRGGKLAH